MVKRMISRLSVLAVLIVFMAACSKKAEYIHVIPADASAVASINLNSLADKAGLNDKQNEGMKQKMMEALKSGMNAAAFQQLEKIMKNPSQSGIDVKAPVFVFTSKTFISPTIVAKYRGLACFARLNGQRRNLPAYSRRRGVQFHILAEEQSIGL